MAAAAGAVVEGLLEPPPQASENVSTRLEMRRRERERIRMGILT